VSLFKRRKSADGPEGFEPGADDAYAEGPDDALDDTGVLDAGDDWSTDEDGEVPAGAFAGAPTSGPFDVEEAPDEPRLDLGALQLPLVEGVEVQLQVDEASGLVTAAMVVLGESAVQLQAFAAPRHEGIWGEVSEEIASGISQQGGTADVTDGPFGRELLGRVPAQLPDGKVGFQPMRFAGVDGPRWLLRAVFHGRAAIEPDAAQPLEALVRRVVVVRGIEPMGPRELLALRLPEGAAPVDPDAAEVEQIEQEGPQGQPGPQGQQGQQGRHERKPTSDADLNPFERGPEITEIH
jgi:hypothetical protein